MQMANTLVKPQGLKSGIFSNAIRTLLVLKITSPLLFTFSIISVLFMNASLAKASASSSLLSEKEKQSLNTLILNHEFYSGCVTQEIADRQSMLCDTQKQCTKLSTKLTTKQGEDKALSKEAFADQLDYQTWLTIYQACIANKH